MSPVPQLDPSPPESRRVLYSTPFCTCLHVVNIRAANLAWSHIFPLRYVTLMIDNLPWKTTAKLEGRNTEYASQSMYLVVYKLLCIYKLSNFMYEKLSFTKHLEQVATAAFLKIHRLGRANWG